MGSDLSAIDQAVGAATEYGAAINEAYKVVTQSGGDIELASVHMRRAGGHLVTLVKGLQALHEQLDRPVIVPGISGYDEQQVIRIVRAAIAFREAAPRHKWPRQAWGEMAEICAAVDRKPGPDDRTATAPARPALTFGPVLAGRERNGADQVVHAAVAYPMAVYRSVCRDVELDERAVDYARRVPPTVRCSRDGCTEAYASADQEIRARS